MAVMSLAIASTASAADPVESGRRAFLRTLVGVTGFASIAGTPLASLGKDKAPAAPKPAPGPFDQEIKLNLRPESYTVDTEGRLSLEMTDEELAQIVPILPEGAPTQSEQFFFMSRMQPYQDPSDKWTWGKSAKEQPTVMHSGKYFEELLMKGDYFKKDLGDVLFVVDTRAQKVDLYVKGKFVKRSNTSTGKPGHETPTGVFRVYYMDKNHRSVGTAWAGAKMPFFLKATGTGEGLHIGEGTDSGKPLSHGCMRLPPDTAKMFFELMAEKPGEDNPRVRMSTVWIVNGMTPEMIKARDRVLEDQAGNEAVYFKSTRQ